MRTLTAVLLPAIPADAEGGPRPEGWHYASLSRRGGHPIGGCADHDPHPTETAARECYAAYQRNRIRIPEQPNLGDWTGCVARSRNDGNGPYPHRDGDLCDAPTKHAVTIDGEGFRLEALCPKHCARDYAILALGLDKPAGDAWVS